MSETEDNPSRAPRFPYVGALLCAACVCAAAWTWMRFSYCWHVTPTELVRAYYGRRDHPSASGIYVRITALHDGWVELGQTPYLVLKDPTGSEAIVKVLFEVRPGSVASRAGTVVLAGRLTWASSVAAEAETLYIGIIQDANRAHGASVAGLVVGAMGVFVFGAAFRHWLGERRAFRPG